MTAVLVSLITSCSSISFDDGPDAAIDGSPFAITDVTVLPMSANISLPAQTVLIANGRIAGIGPSATTAVPAGYNRMDGKGKFLLPGLIDMHVHIRSADLERYLDAGVTSVRNMWGYDQLPALVGKVDAGERKGPRVFSLTAGFDGSPAVWPQTQISDDPGDIPALLDRQQSLGFREIKVYQKLSRAAYDTIVAESRRRGMTFAGHMPPQVGLDHVLESGQRSIEHLGGYSVGSGLEAQVVATTRAGTYNCPTLAIQTMLNTTAPRANELLTITGALYRGGARLLVGTDAGIDRTRPGSSIHDELELFVRAGLTPFDALLGATRTAAEYLGQSDEIGTIEAGKEADLLLLRSNPFANIATTREIVAVVVNGRRHR